MVRSPTEPTARGEIPRSRRGASEVPWARREPRHRRRTARSLGPRPRWPAPQSRRVRRLPVCSGQRGGVVPHAPRSRADAVLRHGMAAGARSRARRARRVRPGSGQPARVRAQRDDRRRDRARRHRLRRRRRARHHQPRLSRVPPSTVAPRRRPRCARRHRRRTAALRSGAARRGFSRRADAAHARRAPRSHHEPDRVAPADRRARRAPRRARRPDRDRRCARARPDRARRRRAARGRRHLLRRQLSQVGVRERRRLSRRRARRDHRAPARHLARRRVRVRAPNRFHAEHDWMGTHDPSGVSRRPDRDRRDRRALGGGWPATIAAATMRSRSSCAIA